MDPGNGDWCLPRCNHTSQDKPQMEFYEDLIKVGKKSGSDLKMMVFSGDDDSSEFSISVCAFR